MKMDKSLQAVIEETLKETLKENTRAEKLDNSELAKELYDMITNNRLKPMIICEAAEQLIETKISQSKNINEQIKIS